MPVLDTSFLIDLDRGNDAAMSALHWLVEQAEDLIVPGQVAAEYISGFEDPVAALRDIEASFTLVLEDRSHLLEVAALARKAIQDGGFPGWADARIGATSVLEGCEVVTADPDHFAAFGCSVWDYRRAVRHTDS